MALGSSQRNGEVKKKEEEEGALIWKKKNPNKYICTCQAQQGWPLMINCQALRRFFSFQSLSISLI